MHPDVSHHRLTALIGALLGLLLLLSACIAPDDRRTALLGDEDERDGSGIVNGLRVDVDADTPVYRDGEPMATNAFELGQVLTIEADGDIDDLSARSIKIRREVLGPIDFIDQGRRSMSILGQEIVLPEKTLGERSVELGQMVAVSGFSLPEGTIVASRIDAADAGEQPQLYGEYAVSEGGVTVGGLAVRGLSVSPSLAGREVFVRGSMVDGAMAATDLEPEPEAPFDGRLARLSIAGFVDREKRTLARLRLTRLLDTLSEVVLPGGLNGRFGVFEGRWLGDRALFDVDRQISLREFFDASINDKRQEIRQERREDRQERRLDRRQERQDRRDDRQDRRDDRRGERGQRR